MILSIHNAVNRKTKTDQPIGPEYAVDLYEAIKAVTINSAYQCFDEAIKGSIEPGKYADFVILSQNPFAVEKSDIQFIEIVKTVKENKLIFSMY